MITFAEPTDLDALRLRTEFLSRPELRISASQTARMLGLRSTHAAALLESLEREGFLARVEDGSYRRAPAAVAAPPTSAQRARQSVA
jgi:DNA-binding IclR family transcriptional regulator